MSGKGRDVAPGFGALLRVHRLSARMSQQVLAERAGVSVGTVRSLEQGRTSLPRAESVGRLAQALGLDVFAETQLRDAAQPVTADGSAVGAGVVTLRILGPLEAWHGRERVALGEPKQRAVLGLLALAPDVAVHREALIDALWDADPPATAVNLVQGYVGRLRRLLDPGRSWADACGLIVSARTSYRLRVGVGQLDLLAFGRFCSDARAARADDDLIGAYDAYGRALALWRGEPLCDIDVLRAHHAVTALRSRYTETVIGCAEVACAVGASRQVLGHLQQATGWEPLNEQVHAWLMTALAADGQQAAALAIYDQLRLRLDEQLGVLPGRELAEAHVRVLRQELPAALSPARPPAPAAMGTAPRQLPAAVPHFTGRATELGRLASLVDGSAGTVVVSAIGGTAGVGKTALAVHWAHQVADRFPDGQLYVNLRGYDPGHPVAAADALAGFLQALGVPADDVPGGQDERAARYRSLLAGRRMLVLVDNAGSAEQARPLLPGTPGCVAVVTSRDSLGGLVALEGAVRLDLDLLPLADAAGLLCSLLGDRAVADPDAVTELAEQCCRLPLALRVAAELAASRPSVQLADLVAELADQQRRLDLLDSGGDSRTAVRVVFSWSYQNLPGDAARLFRLLSLHPGLDLDAHSAAALCGGTGQDGGTLLGLLSRAHLVQAQGPDLYGMHDLLRAYARELAAGHDAAGEQRAALNRLFDYYLYTAAAAMDTLFPADRSRRPRIKAPMGLPGPPADSVGLARAWLDAQRANLVAVTVDAADHGWPHHAARLAATLARYLEAGGHYPEAVTVHTHALVAARHAGDRACEAAALISLGHADTQRGRYEQAVSYLEQALALCRQAGDQIGQARAHTNLGIASFELGRYQQAAGHHRQALALHRRGGDLTGQARALNNLGVIAQRLGDLSQAIGHFQQSLTLHRQAFNRIGEATPLSNLGRAYRAQGRWHQALECTQRSLVLCRDTGNRVGEAYALAYLGDIYLIQDRHDQAMDHHQQALAIFRQTGDQPGRAQALNSIGEALRAVGQPVRARAEHAVALRLASQTGDKYEQARAHNGLAHCHHPVGDPAQAHHHWQQALALYAELGVPEAGQIRAQLSAAGHPLTQS